MTLLATVLARGGRILTDGPRPRLLVPNDLKTLVEKHRETLRGEVACYIASRLDPRLDFCALLDRWAGMDEAAVTQDEVDALKNAILDVFATRPLEADGWYKQWRAAHPQARLS